MRTNKKWELKYKEKAIQANFSPRIVKALHSYKQPLDIKGEVRSTFIYGAVQSGKTIRAAFMCLEELKNIYLTARPIKTRKVLFVPFTTMLEEIKATYKDKETDESKIIEKYTKCHLLVIDDFLSKKPTDWVIDTLYHIINLRYENLLKTIITSNYNLEEIEELLEDQRITARINATYIIEKKNKV